jgi:hypothetical protein
MESLEEEYILLHTGREYNSLSTERLATHQYIQALPQSRSFGNKSIHRRTVHHCRTRDRENEINESGQLSQAKQETSEPAIFIPYLHLLDTTAKAIYHLVECLQSPPKE